ncbi:MAG: hypothetical protein ACJ79S_09255 [Gemmatimonadaceae bacterium]
MTGRDRRGGSGNRVRGLRRGAATWGAVAVVAILLLLGVALWIAARGARRDVLVTTRGGQGVMPEPKRGRSRAGQRAPAGADAGAVDSAAFGSAPQAALFDGCPPEGDGGDRALNRLKNRASSGAWRDVRLDSLLALRWPEGIAERHRARWPAAAARAVGRQEAQGVRVEGYLVRARQQGPESCNCHGAAARYRDYHLWLTADTSLDRDVSLIAEMSPRLRAVHRGWNLKALNGVVRRKERVRVSGWLLLDQEHPEQIGKTRGTLWEIHPVMQFEVRRGSRWVPLDSLRA